MPALVLQMGFDMALALRSELAQGEFMLGVQWAWKDW